MGNTEGKKDEIPESFSSCEEAGEFWDSHDSTHYLEHMTPVEEDARLEQRHFEIEVDEDIIIALEKRAHSEDIPASKLANDLLRKHLLVG
jgi:hypothetical protein